MSNCPGCGFSANSEGALTCTLCGHALATEDARPRGRARRQRHLLLRVGGAPVELDSGEVKTIGRGTDCDFTVSSPQVSRVHAELDWEGDRPLLRDLGSENGTLVNGEAIRERVLADCDSFEVGPVEWTYRLVSAQGSTGRVAELLAADDADVPGSGDLAEVSLYALLSRMEQARASGTVHVDGDDLAGTVAVREGALVHAAAGERSGQDAVFALLGCEVGRFHVEADVPEERNVGEGAIAELLLDHAGRMDARHTMPLDRVDLGDLET